LNPNYTHRIPNVNPRLIFWVVYILKDIWGSLYGADIRGLIFGEAYLRDFTVCSKAVK